MEKCANCQAELDPAWKFCVTCGTPTPADAPAATQSAQTPSEPRGEQPQNDQSPSEKPTEQPAGKPPTRAAMKAAAASSTADTKPKRTKARWEDASAEESTPWAGNVLIEEIPSAIRNSQDGPLTRAAGRRKVDVALIVSISLGVAGAALIVYLVILVFGTRG